VEDGITKLDVISGKVVVVPFDTSSPITAIDSGNSLSVSDDEVVKTNLDTNSADKLDESSVEPQSKSGGGCLIATAAYGSELAPQVQMLREIRDNVLFTTNSGAGFMMYFNALYYSFSPTISDWERENPVFRELIKVTITPMLSTLSILNYVDINSEQELQGYGIGIILLNIGMYFVLPAVVILRLKSKFAK
jgi:hypothetical protein